MANDKPNSERSRASAGSDPSVPSQRDLAFKTFGVLDAGQQSKTSLYTSLAVNGSVLLLVFLLGMTAKKVISDQKKLEAISFNAVKPPEPVKPPPPPPRLPKPPIVQVEQPKIKVPTVEVPEPPKIQPVIMKAAPTPVVTPPAPKAVTPPPAPKPVAIQIAQAASVANSDTHPSAIRLGSQSNPINNTAGPAVSPVNLGRSGAPGMAAGNTGLGGPSKIAIAGSGSPNGSQGGRDNGPQPIKGISNGVPGGTGPMSARPVGAIAIAKNDAPPPPGPASVASGPAKSAPKLIFKPKPEYTEEARQLHLEGTVYVKIHVASSGAVSVVGVQSGLGHGLDQAAVRAVQGMHFQPAMANGQPTDWDGVVNINFQLAS